jgi:Uma2 family endonuclease
MIKNLQEDSSPLANGQQSSRDEFLRRWEMMPGTKFAELIGGITYMPSPLSRPHGYNDKGIVTWVGVYEAATPGCESACNSTWLMLDDCPQPDADLRILPEFGGQSSNQGDFPEGAPEFAAEISISSSSYDLHEKLELYQQARVQEYLAIVIKERLIRWHRLVDGKYEIMPASADGIHRSLIFPGLWLDGQAYLNKDMKRVLEVLGLGLQQPEHNAFIAQLAANRSSTS